MLNVDLPNPWAKWKQYKCKGFLDSVDLKAKVEFLYHFPFQECDTYNSREEREKNFN